jgi:putative glucoamylase/uncharacterized protein DUF3131
MQGERELRRYAVDTWRSFEALLAPSTGLPADWIDGGLRPESRARYTSPTNIAMYLWATLAARDLGLIAPAEALQRATRTLDSVAALERHEASGQFYNWYDPETLATLRAWPESPNGRTHPFASSVDNGWLATALIMVAHAAPALRDRAWALASRMSFAAYYDPNARSGGPPGLLRGGFWPLAEAPPGAEALPRGDYSAMGETVVYTGHHYGAFNTEARIASYIAIALGQVPAEHYFAPWRARPEGGDGGRGATHAGAWRTYLGVPVFEGASRYGARQLVPTWGGSMFEALMPALVVPEEQWGPRSWGVNHPLYVQSQIAFGLEEAGYGYWGFSPASDPAGGYREYGVAALGMAADGYTSSGARPPGGAHARSPAPGATSHGEGVVTPHAVFLALDFAPDAALGNLAALGRDFADLYGPGGFRDSVNVATGRVADRYLALDQGMVMAACANALGSDGLQSYLAATLRPALEPLMALEVFSAGVVGAPPPGA